MNIVYVTHSITGYLLGRRSSGHTIHVMYKIFGTDCGINDSFELKKKIRSKMLEKKSA